MSEPIWTHMTVRYPAKWNREVERADEREVPCVIANIGDYLGEPDWSVDGDVCTYQANGEANYGLTGDTMDGLWSELTKLRIPWEGHSEAKYEYDSEWLFYDGNADGKILSGDVSNGGAMILTHGGYKAIIEGRHEWAATVEDYFTKPPMIDDCSIAHLMDAPHPDDEDAVDEKEATL